MGRGTYSEPSPGGFVNCHPQDQRMMDAMHPLINDQLPALHVANRLPLPVSTAGAIDRLWNSDTAKPVAIQNRLHNRQCRVLLHRAVCDKTLHLPLQPLIRSSLYLSFSPIYSL